MRLALPQVLRARIEDEARALFPRECCGLIEGVREGGLARAFALHPARNLSRRPDRFEIAPQDHFVALKAARGNGRSLIGCYHSHPGGKARPSPRDRAGAGEDGFFWLIAALEDRAGPVAVGAFVYLGSSARFLAVPVVDGHSAVSRA